MAHHNYQKSILKFLCLAHIRKSYQRVKVRVATTKGLMHFCILLLVMTFETSKIAAVVRGHFSALTA